MVPAGEPTEAVVNGLAEILAPEDIVIDGGNSNCRDTIRRAAIPKQRGMHFVKVDTCGGICGLTDGCSMMVGGDFI